MPPWPPRANWCLASVAVAVAGIGVGRPSAAQADDTAQDRADEADAERTATDAASTRAQPVGYGAMPGGLHVAAAETPAAGTAEVALLSGFGYRKGLLAKDHTFDRAIGDVAVAFAPVPRLLLGLSLDGRYDRHDHATATDPTDSGYVGDPHLLVRYAAPFGKVSVGGQLGIWVPGKNAPSLALSATSVDARGLVSLNAGFGTLSLDAGFRFDNSAKSVDHPERLEFADQVSLGVSKYNAALVGAALRVPLGGKLFGELEASGDIFVGSGAPGPILRGGAVLGLAASDVVSVIAFVEGAKVPAFAPGDVMNGEIKLIPYEPTITGGLGLQARFGGGKRAPGSQIIETPHQGPIAVVELADVTGSVVDDAGKPVVGATVSVKLRDHTGTAVTDDRGGYAIAHLPIGKTVSGKTELDDTGAEISVEVANKKPGSATLTLTRGANAVPRITLDPMLPPGQLRAVIINIATSRPVPNASVAIEPGGTTATSGPDGKFTVDLPPGHYRITVTAKGLAQQQLDVNIDPNGVAIKNIDMHR